MSIPFANLEAQYRFLQSDIQARITSVLEHGQYIMGPEVLELEDRLAEYVGVEHCITVGSGTDALLISLMALKIGAGDEVITTPFSFIATAEVIALLGAKPVFVDIEKDTCNIDANLITEKISPKTKAIIPVSLYGQPSDMNAINALAREYGDIPVIEDAAQSFGASYFGSKSCSLSTVGCTSFFPSKPLGCYGDGGAIFTNDDALAESARRIRVHGQSERYVHTEVGLGGRMDTLQAAVVLAKLDLFSSDLDRRISAGQRYDKFFDSICLPRVAQREGRQSVYGQYTVFVEERDGLREKLKKIGAPTAIHYPLPINEQPAYKHFCCGTCTPIAALSARSVLSLPIGPYLSHDHQSQILEVFTA